MLSIESTAHAFECHAVARFNPPTRTRAKVPAKAVGLNALAKDLHVAFVELKDLSKAAGEYPIAFVQDSSTESGFRPVALMRSAAAKALCQALEARMPDAAVQGGNSAATLLKYAPQALLTLGAHSTSAAGASKPEDLMTRKLCSALVSNNLLTPVSLPLYAGQDAAFGKLARCYMVSEKRLNSLGRERFSELYYSGFLHHIHVHLKSLGKIKRLSMT